MRAATAAKRKDTLKPDWAPSGESGRDEHAEKERHDMRERAKRQTGDLR